MEHAQSTALSQVPPTLIPLFLESPVAARAYWKGFLKLSLVSCPISLFPATSERDKINFHQINKRIGHRIKYKKVDATTTSHYAVCPPESIGVGF